MQQSEISFAIIAAVFSGLLLSVMMAMFMMFTLRDRSRSRYDEDRQSAILSDMRNSFESQIARLNAQLTATEGRWRETNHLLLSSQTHQPEITKSNTALDAKAFVRSLGIEPNQIKVDDNLVFMLTPFAEEERDVYQAIAEVCQRNGFLCVRGDETRTTGDILPHIVKLMLSARIIVANITSRNPNVFYELGIAHAIGKKTVLVSKMFEAVPFDLQSKRIVFYTDIDDLTIGFAEAMLQTFIRD